jgi:tetratricopeptide (TPR) repeat protein
LLAAALAVALAAVGGCTDPETALKNHLGKGEALIAEGRYEQAGVELRNAMRIDPKGTEALFLAGMIGEENGNFQSALQHYRRVVELDPKHLRAKARIAMFQVLGGAVDAAEQQSNEITGLDPAFPGGQSVRAAVLLARGKRDAALEAGLKVLEQYPAERDAVPLVAGIYVGLRDDEAARDVLLRAVQTDPKLISARSMLAVIARRLSDNALAETQYREIAKLVPRSAAPRINLALFLSGLDRLDEAEKVLRESIEADSKDIPRVLTLVEFLGERRGAEVAEKELNAQVASKPKAFALQLRLAAIDLGAGRMQEAENKLKAVIDNDSGGSSAALARAALIDLMLKANRRAEAEQLIAAALTRNSVDSTALMWRARLALRDRRNTQAITDLRAVMRDLPDSPEVVDLLARAYRANDQLDLSIAAIQDSIERYPLRADLRLVLAEHLMNARRFADADRAVESAMKIEPNSPRGLAIRIDIQQASGKPKDALAIAMQMKTVAPQQPVGYLSAAQAQLSLNRPDLAAKEYDEAVRRFPFSEQVLRTWASFAASQKRLDSVIAPLDEMIAKQPRLSLLHLLRGEALAALRRIEPAEAARASLRLSITITAPGGQSSTALRCGWARSWNTLSGFRSSRAGM